MNLVDPVLVHYGEHHGRLYINFQWILEPNTHYVLKTTTDFVNFKVFRDFPPSPEIVGEGLTVMQPGRWPVMEIVP